jgi:hypothetical protein
MFLRNNRKRIFKITLILAFATLYLHLYKMLRNHDDGMFEFNRIQVRKDKYVVYQCTHSIFCGGWADRLKGMIGAYVWSLLSNRTFLIDAHKGCPLTNIYDTNQIDWHENLDMIIAKTKTKELSSNKMYKIDDVTIWGVLREVDPANLQKDKDVIIIQSNIDWVRPLSENPNLTERIRNLGFEKDQFQSAYVFKKFYREMFKLTSNLQAKYSDYLKQIGPSTLICLQLRTHYNDWSMTDENMEYIFNFTKQVLVPMAGKDYKILVTADDSNNQEKAINALRAHNAFKIDGSIFNIDIGSSNCESYEKTYLDFHLFQNCKIALIGQSGYGKYGIWNRDNPFENFFVYVYRNSTGILGHNLILQMNNSNDTNEYFKYQ